MSLPNINHPIERSVLASCAVTLLFLVVSLALFGPFIAILVPALVIASLCRFIANTLLCDSCQSGPSTLNSEFFSPDRFLVAEETRWLKTKSKIIIMIILNGRIELEALRLTVVSRLITRRKDDLAMSNELLPSQQGSQTVPGNGSVSSSQLLYPKFSQQIIESKMGWKWRCDDRFKIENHVHAWKDFVPTSILSNTHKLSELISHINSLPLNLDHSPWDCYLVPLNDSPLKEEANCQVNNSHSGESTQCRSILIFRLHPSLSDGISLVHILCSSLSDEQCPVALKDRFHSTGKLFNSIRALFVGPVVFFQKWLFTPRDSNIFHSFRKNGHRSNNSSTKVSTDPNHLSLDEKSFHFCTYSLSTVSRIKGVTRSTLTEIFLAAVAGALRTYQQHIGNVPHPYDLLCLLPADLTKEHHNFTGGPNSSSMASKTSNQSSVTDSSKHTTNNYSLLDFGLPTNTEGMIPRLWEVKQRMEEVKNSADSMVISGLLRILKHLCPERIGRRVMKTFYNKNSLSISSLQGPDYLLSICNKQIHKIVYWFPSLCDVSLSISCFSYGDSFTCSVSGDYSSLPKMDLILDAIVYQWELLNKLLENRRISGEHKSQRHLAATGDKSKVPTRLDSSDRQIIKNDLAPSSSASTDHLYTRLSSIQNQLHHDKNLSAEDLDALRSEFSNLIGILRRRKSCGIDTNGEMADFDEDIEEMSGSKIENRRSSLTGLLGISSHWRSLATYLIRPISNGCRSRSNSKTAIQSSNYQLSPSRSSSKRPSIRITDDIEGGLGYEPSELKSGLEYRIEPNLN